MTVAEDQHIADELLSVASLLQEVLVGTSTTVGEGFLAALVTTLAKVFNVRYAIVGRLLPGDKEIRTLKVCADGKMAENIVYALAGTPCEHVVGMMPRYFNTGVADLFPDDELLRQLEVDCYLGVPLYSASHEPLGNLLLLDSKPLPEALVPLALKLLELFAQRTAEEITWIERDKKLTLQDTQLGFVLNNSRDGLLTSSNDARIMAVNKAYCALLGYEEHELIGKYIYEIEANESVAEVEVRAQKIIEQGIDRFVSRHRCKDGTTRDLELSISYIVELDQFLTIAQDVTERLALERRLFDSEQRYQAFTELISDFHYVCTRKPAEPYRIQWISGRFDRITGYSIEELMAIGCWLPLVHADDREHVSTGLLRLAAGDEARVEFRLIAKDKSTRWIREYSRCVTDPVNPDLLRLYGSARDITVTHENTLALQAAENAYRTIFNATNDGIFIMETKQGMIIDCNKQAMKLLGRQRAELIGSNPVQLSQSGNPDFGDEQSLSYIRAAADGVPQLFEWLCVRPDNSIIWVEVSLRAAEINGRQRLLAVGRDVSDRKQSMLELQQARDAALQSTTAKNEFLANMSHEVRTPLNGIMGLSQLLRTTSLTGEQSEYMDMLDSSAKNLLALINDILDISRIEAGSLAIRETAFGPVKLLREVERIYEKPAADKGIVLNIQLSDALPPALIGDQLRLKQVLINLIGNAIKFTDQGEVTLEVGLLEESAKVIMLRFAVSDSGIGMSAETLQKIFNPFTQADASTSRAHGGSGLGLAICRRLSELMGGVIHAESSLGHGSRFVVELPFGRYLGVHDVDTPKVEVEAIQLAPLRILLVEDQEVNRTFVQRLLERQGHLIATAADGLLALELLGQNQYDLMLLDIQMPGMGGEEVLSRLRQEEMINGKHLPVIALTAHALAGDREKLLASGFDGYVSKPIQMDKLVAEMGHVLAMPAKP